MTKPCCEPGDPKPTASWKSWMKRAGYVILILIVLILLWKQFYV